MGSGKKNKRGGAPKQKGRLAAALVSVQMAQASRAKVALAEEQRVERAKALKLRLAGGGGAKTKKAKAPKGYDKGNSISELDGAVEADKEERIAEESQGVVDLDEPKAHRPGPAKAKFAKGRKRSSAPIPYGLNERILLVGEGNFSFAHSLVRFDPPRITPALLLATSYDSLDDAQRKYPDLMEHVLALRESGARVQFGVDATALEKCREIKEAVGSGGWDKVGFNFPHVGAGITDQDRNVRANQTLVLRFFRSVAPHLRKGPSAAPTIPSKKRPNPTQGKRPPVIKKRAKTDRTNDDDDEDHELTGGGALDDEDVDLTEIESGPKPAGAVLMTLRTHAPYSLWSLSALGTRGPLVAPSILPKPLPKTPQPTFVVRRSMEFDPLDYDGYEHRRTIGFRDGVSSGKNEDLTLTARERGLKRHGNTGSEPSEEPEDAIEGRRGKKGSMRTWEFELVPVPDADDAYD